MTKYVGQHAPQVPNIGRYVLPPPATPPPELISPSPTTSGQQHELLDWLSEVTFPMEAKFADPRFARKAYHAVVRRIIDSGVRVCRSF